MCKMSSSANNTRTEYMMSKEDNPGATKKVSGLFEAIVDKEIVRISEEMQNIASKRLLQRREELKAFEKSVTEIWGISFHLLDVFIQATLDLGASFNAEHRPDAVRTKDFVFEALSRLHGRGCRTAGEVLVLMERGYASGAFSRWRTIHELAVVSHFVRAYGNATAERYLEHNQIESCRAMNLHQKYSDKLGVEPYSEDEMRESKKVENDLCKRFGKEFTREYGWASVSLHNRNPRLTDLERAVGLDYLRPYYKLASHDIHAGPKGIIFSIGLSPGAFKRIIPAGPSNAGMADPGQCTAISLFQITEALMATHGGLEKSVRLKALDRLRASACSEFVRIHKSVEEPQMRRKKRADYG